MTTTPAYLSDRRTAGKPNPAEVIWLTVDGRTFRVGRRTAAHIEVTLAAFAEAFPHLRLVLAQPCYNVGVEQSAYTHDWDGVLDWYVSRDGSVLASTEDDYWAVQRFLRLHGWATWFRCTGSWASRGSWHLHAASLGCPGPVGMYVPGQVDDYHRHSLGLKGQHDSGLDGSWFPDDIEATYFDYPAWLEANDMTPEQDARLERVEKTVTELAAAENKRAADELKRDRASYRREDALKKAVRDLGGDVGQVLAAVKDEA